MRSDAERSSERSVQRLVYLDLLRAVAIFLVLGAHLPIKPTDQTWGRDFFVVWERIGWVGVDLFFCLSGFLIGGLLFAEHKQWGKINLMRFFVRRAFKIWPSYILFVIVATVAVILNQRPLSLIWPNLLHVQNYFPSAYGHTWSLAVEEHFYLALPLLLACLISLNRKFPERAFRSLPWFFVGISLFCLLGRIYAAWGVTQFDFFRNQTQTHIRFDSLFAGVLLAYAVHMAPHTVRWLYPWRWMLLVAGILCFVPAAIFYLEFTPFLYTAGYSLLWSGSMAITLWSWFASTGDQKGGGNPPVPLKWVTLLALVGTYSYSIYLWHMPLATASSKYIWNRFLNPEEPWSLILLSIIYGLTAIGIGMCLYMAVERPALSIRDRFFPAMARVAADSRARIN